MGEPRAETSGSLFQRAYIGVIFQISEFFFFPKNFLDRTDSSRQTENDQLCKVSNWSCTCVCLRWLIVSYRYVPDPSRPQPTSPYITRFNSRNLSYSIKLPNLDEIWKEGCFFVFFRERWCSKWACILDLKLTMIRHAGSKSKGTKMCVYFRQVLFNYFRISE